VHANLASVLDMAGRSAETVEVYLAGADVVRPLARGRGAAGPGGAPPRRRRGPGQGADAGQWAPCAAADRGDRLAGPPLADRAGGPGRGEPDGPAREPAAATDDLGLTPREREVLALVADGRTNRQIAQALFISSKTASVHVSNILAKLGVANRGEAAAVAHRLRLTG
jgi:DNA-binding CsgD family transcriptional regulator